MATTAQIKANRNNAALSTGPRSVEGKQKVSTNATKHGLSGAHIIIHGEDPAQYDALRNELGHDLNPSGVTENFLVDQIAQAQWKLMRIARIDACQFRPSPEFLENHPEESPDDVAGAIFYHDCNGPQLILKLSRYESAARRAYHQALNQLLKLQATRRKLAQTPAPQPDTANYKTNPIPPAPAPASAPSLPIDRAQILEKHIERMIQLNDLIE